MKKFIIPLGLLLIFLSACNKAETASYELCGYGPMFVVNGTGYLQHSTEENTYTLAEKLGVITEKIDEQYHPVENLTSNSLHEGAVIYSVKGHEEFLIAKTNEDKFYLYKEIQ